MERDKKNPLRTGEEVYQDRYEGLIRDLSKLLGKRVEDNKKNPLRTGEEVYPDIHEHQVQFLSGLSRDEQESLLRYAMKHSPTRKQQQLPRQKPLKAIERAVKNVEEIVLARLQRAGEIVHFIRPRQPR